MSKKSTSSSQRPQAESSLDELVVGGDVYHTHLTNKFRNRTKWTRPDKLMVEAVIPGTIQKILVETGQEVESGDPLLILEAMKMRNEVLSPLAGVIKKIYVSEGEMVSKSFLLMEMD